MRQSRDLVHGVIFFSVGVNYHRVAICKSVAFRWIRHSIDAQCIVEACIGARFGWNLILKIVPIWPAANEKICCATLIAIDCPHFQYLSWAVSVWRVQHVRWCNKKWNNDKGKLCLVLRTNTMLPLFFYHNSLVYFYNVDLQSPDFDTSAPALLTRTIQPLYAFKTGTRSRRKSSGRLPVCIPGSSEGWPKIRE